MKERNPSILHTEWHHNNIVLLLVAFLSMWGLTWCAYLMKNWKWLKILFLGKSSWPPQRNHNFWKLQKTLLKCHILYPLFFQTLMALSSTHQLYSPLFLHFTSSLPLGKLLLPHVWISQVQPSTWRSYYSISSLSVSAIQNWIFLLHKQFLTSSFFFSTTCAAALSLTLPSIYTHVWLFRRSII